MKEFATTLISFLLLAMLLALLLAYMKRFATTLISFCASIFAQKKGTFTDPRDGKVYKTVKIGTQTWFAENLNYEAEGSVCYENNPDNGAKYGRLYDWETAMKVCPKGWHLPTNEEWDKLLHFVDDDTASVSVFYYCYMCNRLATSLDSNSRFRFIRMIPYFVVCIFSRLFRRPRSRTRLYQSHTAGKHLKAVSGWKPCVGIKNLDTYGFSALPGGYGNSDCCFSSVGSNGYWWSASEDENCGINAYNRYMDYHFNGAYWYSGEREWWGIGDKSDLLSVRCLQD